MNVRFNISNAEAVEIRARLPKQDRAEHRGGANINRHDLGALATSAAGSGLPKTGKTKKG